MSYLTYKRERATTHLVTQTEREKGDHSIGYQFILNQYVH